MSRVAFRLLGGFAASLTPGDLSLSPGRKAQALLAFLAVPPGRAHSRGKLASLFWGATDDEQARHSLRQTLFALRKALPPAMPPLFVSAGETVALNPAAVDVDVVAFEALASQASPEALEAAVALYRGHFLEGARLDEPLLEEWVRHERERLRMLAVGALDALVSHWTRARDTGRAIRAAMRLLAIEPAREPTHRALMRLHLERRDFTAALTQYRACEDALRRDLGVRPDGDTRRLHDEIVAARARATAGTAASSGTDTGPPRRRVLIVEDEPVTHAVLEGYLALAGHDVHTAADGADALLALGRDRFDLVVSDIAMPMLDGLKLLEIVRAKRLDVPVILVTGRPAHDLEAQGLRLGAADFVAKPIEREPFLLRVERALGAADHRVGPPAART